MKDFLYTEGGRRYGKRLEYKIALWRQKTMLPEKYLREVVSNIPMPEDRINYVVELLKKNESGVLSGWETKERLLNNTPVLLSDYAYIMTELNRYRIDQQVQELLSDIESVRDGVLTNAKDIHRLE